VYGYVVVGFSFADAGGLQIRVFEAPGPVTDGVMGRYRSGLTTRTGICAVY
jgi:hypothetical protein